jgi:hypothetical protein
MFVLERSYRGRWERRNEVTVKRSGVERLSAEQCAAELRELAAMVLES